MTNNESLRPNPPTTSSRGRAYRVLTRPGSTPSPAAAVQQPSQPRERTGPVRVREERGTASSRWRGQQTQAETLGERQKRQLVRGNYECVICVSAISRRGRVWICRDGCWAIVHLSCVEQWRQSSTAGGGGGWRCPVCSKTHREKPDYRCFCGKTSEPEFRAGQTPHSCGEVCSRKLDCGISGHTCVELCHAGPCGGCVLEHAETVDRVREEEEEEGKEVQAIRREEEEVEEGERCGRKLRCGKHKCQRSRRLCDGRTDHECLQICDKMLSCGIHKCDFTCHLGRCGPCERLERELRECPCGRTRANRRLRCGEVQNFTCQNVCGKQKISCEHVCTDLCHYGQCALCVELVDRLCAGGHRLLVNRPCHVKNSSCGSKCNKSLPNCSHLCKSVCHSGECPSLCTQPCEFASRTCGHPCGAPCHGPSDSTCPVDTVPCPAKVVSLCECGLRSEEVICASLSGKAGASIRTLPCTPACEKAVRQAALKAAFVQGSFAEMGGPRYFEHLLDLGERWNKYLILIEQIFSDVFSSKTQTPSYLPSGCVGRRALALEYAQVYWRLDAGVSSGGQVWVRFSAKARKPSVLLSDVLSLSSKDQRGPWTLIFDDQCPWIYVYDIPRLADTCEKIPLVLEEFIGEFRVRRPNARELFIDFVDAEKALRAFRRLKATELDSNLKRCELRNVPLVAGQTEEIQELVV